MKQLMCVLSAILILAVASCKRGAADKEQTINPLLGDISFVSKFGHSPTPQTDESLRIRTHFEYVEELLRKRDISHLTPALQARRATILQLLRDYRLSGIFPKNYDHTGARVPCFIDRDGNICAVGYLIAQTAGRQAAEEINRKYKYEKLLAMNDPLLDNWVASSGLTREEAAMIQPSYGFRPPATYNYIKPEYGISSAVLSGVNLSMTAMNGIQIIKGAGGKVIPAIGLITGLGQVVLGAANFSAEENARYRYTMTNESQKVVSMVNIGIGTTTIILSTWNLLTGRTPKERRTSWNIYSFPATGGNTGMALSLTRRF